MNALNKHFLKIGLFLTVLIIILHSCQKPTFSDFKNLEGTWIAAAEDNTTGYEIWTIADDSTMNGTGFQLDANGDTIFVEYMTLIQRNGLIIYRAFPYDDKSKNIDFTFKPDNENRWIFENPLNEFPQQIIYELKDPKHLTITAKGKISGEPGEVFLEFSKYK